MPGRRGRWDKLSSRTRDRWISRYGGRGSRDIRERRAQAAYALGATIGRADAGHETEAAREGRAMSAIFRGVGWTVVEGPTVGERARLARWNSYAGERLHGRITSQRFRQLVRSWAPLRGMAFESDPNVVVAELTRRHEADEAVFVYEGRRQ